MKYPLFRKTAAYLRGMELINFWISLFEMLSLRLLLFGEKKFLLFDSCSSFIFLLLSTMCHKFSVGFKSIDWAGDLSILIICTWIQDLTYFDACFGALSCWKIHSVGISSFANGSMIIFKIFFLGITLHSLINFIQRPDSIGWKTTTHHA